MMVVALILTAMPPAAVAREFRTADAQDDPSVQARNYMAPQVAERTGGRPSLCNFHSRKLGEENGTVMQTLAAAIDLDRTNVALMGGLVPTTNALAIPFLFRSVAQLQRVPGGPVGNEIPESFEPRGFVGTFYDSGARSIYMRDPATAEPIKRVGQTE
jgi:TRAP-type C4-dicarboxylate transport system substrate-binding protein